jgi:RNA polymerase sigma-70 factor (ECF subfamily)
VARDTEQFERLVSSYARLVAAAARRVCGHRHAAWAPDVEQEVYLALWKRLGSGKEIEYPTSYLYKMALTTALAVVRRFRREHSLEEEAWTEPRAGVSDEYGLEPVERRRLLEQVLASAEADEARALRAYLAGFSHTEIAELYGWSASTARHRVYRTLQRLREAMGDTGETSDV